MKIIVEKNIVGKERLENTVNITVLKIKVVISKAAELTPKGREEKRPSKKMKGSTSQSDCGRTDMITYNIKNAKAIFK